MPPPQLNEQRIAPTHQPGRQCANGYVQYVRCFPISESFDKDERNNLALFIGEPRHRARHIGQFNRRFDPPIPGTRSILPFLLRPEGFRSSLSASSLIDPAIMTYP